MPYIITTRTQHDPPKRAADGVTVVGVLRSRRAVATLEEAIDCASDAGATFGDLASATAPQRIGPLADGTVIEVAWEHDHAR
jgi:hypothetical protein